MNPIVDPAWYGGWRQDAILELAEKNQKLSEEFQLGKWPRFDIDLDKGWLTFSGEGRPVIKAPVQVVGTVASGKDWLWAWANNWWSEIVTRDALETRRFGEKHNISELTRESLRDENLEALGWELSAVACRVTSARGVYRAPTGKGLLFVLLREVSFLP
jgi:hypothetical protein